MRDPHVDELIYELKTDGSVRYMEPLPLEFGIPAFDLLAEDILTIRPHEHFGTESAARRSIEPFLRSWEAATYLKAGKAELIFEFQRSRIVDRSPPPPGTPIKIEIPPISSIARVFAPTIVMGRREYPAPPQHFSLSPDMATLLTRYQGFKRGEEPLLAMAYFCLTVAENRGQRRAQAARRLAIDPAVLHKMGELTSTRGDTHSARKHSLSQRLLSDAEHHWLDAALRALIRQVAWVDSGGQPPHLTMTSLPVLA